MSINLNNESIDDGNINNDILKQLNNLSNENNENLDESISDGSRKKLSTIKEINNENNDNNDNNHADDNDNNENNYDDNDDKDNLSSGVYDDNEYFYPSLDDPRFQNKISSKKEFNYVYKTTETCNKSQFILQPHQEFIKRFIHRLTPYNGVLLYHGLGSGKTCSAISISEEYRRDNIHIPTFKKIFIIANPNIQANFKNQLFNPEKLIFKNNRWTIYGCVGNYILEEANITNRMSKEKVISVVNKYINKYYSFVGYKQFSNNFNRLFKNDRELLKQKYQDVMIVIDEAHNIRSTEGNIYGTLDNLTRIIKYNKIIFLSGTPAYHTATDAIVLMHILRQNDNRSIKPDEYFYDKESEKIKNESALKKYCNGYVSYIRGDNPLTFPHQIMPQQFSINDSYTMFEKPTYNYKLDENNVITKHIQHLDIYINELSGYQRELYENCFYYDLKPDILLQCLNIVYPSDKNNLPENYCGKIGLQTVLTKNMEKDAKTLFKYKEEAVNIFKLDKIENYSIKIKNIIENINNSNGIVLIYSKYVWGGVVPMACVLEEMGYSRYTGQIKAKNILCEKKKSEDFKTYSIITGNEIIKGNNKYIIRRASDKQNKDGKNIKIIIITETGSEGIDLYNIRQVHIMDPWWNMSKIEQIIGRARRNCSHMLLEEVNRNVSVFLHGCVFKKDGINEETENHEVYDMYRYKKSEQSSIINGNILKLFKEISIDCNLSQNKNYDNPIIKQRLFNGNIIDFDIRDKPYSKNCNYQKNCSYKCNNVKNKIINDKTFSFEHLHNDLLIDNIKNIFLDKISIPVNNIINSFKSDTISPEQIIYSIDYINGTKFINKHGVDGTIIKKDNKLLFNHHHDILSFDKNKLSIYNPYVYKKKFNVNIKKEFQPLIDLFHKFKDTYLDVKISNMYDELLDVKMMDNEQNLIKTITRYCLEKYKRQTIMLEAKLLEQILTDYFPNILESDKKLFTEFKKNIRDICEEIKVGEKYFVLLDKDEKRESMRTLMPFTFNGKNVYFSPLLKDESEQARNDILPNKVDIKKETTHIAYFKYSGLFLESLENRGRSFKLSSLNGPISDYRLSETKLKHAMGILILYKYTIGENFEYNDEDDEENSYSIQFLTNYDCISHI